MSWRIIGHDVQANEDFEHDRLFEFKNRKAAQRWCDMLNRQERDKILNTDYPLGSMMNDAFYWPERVSVRWRQLVWRLDEAMHRAFRWSPAWLCNYNERQITGE